MMVQLACALLCSLLLPVQDDLLTKTAPADIDAGYKALAAFKGVEWTRDDRPGLVLFVEKSDRKELRYLVEIRAFVLTELRARLTKDLGKATGLELGTRPLVVWLCKDVQRASALAGGAEVWDGYDRARGHVLCAPGIAAAEANLIETLVRGATLALLDGATLKGARVQLSDWLRFGIAAHYATRPAGPMLMKSDPLLGVLSRDQFGGMVDLAKRSPPLEKPARMPRHHHPMGVALFDTMAQYLESCGTTAGDARESQMRRYLEHSHLMASMFLCGFSRGMNPALTEIVAAEAAGKHGDASFSGSFSGELRRERLANLIAVFAADAKDASGQELPDGAVVTGVAAAAEAAAGGSLAKFTEVPGDDLPPAPEPEELPLARALLAALDLQPDAGLKLIEGKSGRDAEARCV